MASIVDRLADAGFVALAPDLYGGPTTHDAAEAVELARSLPVERAAEDLAGPVDHLVGLPAVTSATVGAIGFCMGGGFVVAVRRPDLVEGDRVPHPVRPLTDGRQPGRPLAASS